MWGGRHWQPDLAIEEVLGREGVKEKVAALRRSLLRAVANKDQMPPEVAQDEELKQITEKVAVPQTRPEKFVKTICLTMEKRVLQGLKEKQRQLQDVAGGH